MPDLLRPLMDVYRQTSLLELRHLSDLGRTTFTDMLYLYLIHDDPSATVSSMSEETGVSKGSVTTRINRLVDGGMVTRTRDGSDRRVHRLSLSGPASELLSSEQGILSDAVSEVSGRYTPEELELLHRMLEDLAGTISGSVGSGRGSR